MEIKSEHLAYWYLRLNGFLTITNLVVHPDQGNNQETDVDILGIRLPFRSENLERPMQDEKQFTRVRDKSYVALTEVKTGLCTLNGPWTKPERQNILRVLRFLGPLPQDEAIVAENNISQHGYYTNQLYHITLLCIGQEGNSDLRLSYPYVPQILWDQVKEFIFNRFKDYRREKRSHGQWDQQGIDLWNLFEDTRRDINEFKREISIIG